MRDYNYQNAFRYNLCYVDLCYARAILHKRRKKKTQIQQLASKHSGVPFVDSVFVNPRVFVAPGGTSRVYRGRFLRKNKRKRKPFLAPRILQRLQVKTACIDLMQIWRLLISISCSSTKEMNPITRKSMSILVMQPSFRTVGQTHQPVRLGQIEYHTFVSYFRGFQMSTILRVFGVQL